MKKVDYSYPHTKAEGFHALDRYGRGADEIVDFIRPHPDGQPWLKCCGKDKGQCAYARVAGISRVGPHGQIPHNPKRGRFFCTHRTEDGYMRVCAGWAAFDRAK